MTLYPNAANATRNRQAIIPCQAIINFAADNELCSHVARWLILMPEIVVLRGTGI